MPRLKYAYVSVSAGHALGVGREKQGRTNEGNTGSQLLNDFIYKSLEWCSSE